MNKVLYIFSTHQLGGTVVKSFDNIKYMLEQDSFSTAEVNENLLQICGHDKSVFTNDDLTHSSVLFDDDVGIALKELDRLDKKSKRVKNLYA